MSGNPNLQTEGFRFVQSRRKGKKIRVASFPGNTQEDANFNKAKALQRIKSAKEDISASDLWSSALASVREGLELLGKPKVTEIVCLGLGHVAERVISRFQLGFLLCLRDTYNVTVRIYDPLFWDCEKDLLRDLGFIVLDENQEGKYEINATTIFYLPHCPKQLTNNLLWSNWSLHLENCVVISNSFAITLENTPKRQLSEDAGYILNISPYVVELPIINTFKFYEVFNDTAVHVFPINKLSIIPSDFWENCVEPNYNSKDVEFITNKFVNVQL